MGGGVNGMRECRIVWYLQYFLLLRVGLPRGPLLEYVYLHGFCAPRSEQHGIYGVFACFQKAFFIGQVQSYVFFTVLYTCSLLLRVVFTYVFAHQEPKNLIFAVCWLVLRRQIFQ